MEQQNLEIMRGDDEQIDVAVTDEDDVAIDITGSVIEFTAKSDPSEVDANAVISLSSATPGEIVITDEEDGLFSVYIEKSVTEDLEPKKYFYDIQILLDGQTKTIAYGILTVLPDITRN